MDIKMDCGCIVCSNYDDCTGCKYNGDIVKGCNRMDYNPHAKAINIAEQLRRERLDFASGKDSHKTD